MLFPGSKEDWEGISRAFNLERWMGVSIIERLKVARETENIRENDSLIQLYLN